VGERWPGPAEARQSEGGPELCLRAWGFGFCGAMRVPVRKGLWGKWLRPF
jgi:hypothetical protein